MLRLVISLLVLAVSGCTTNDWRKNRAGATEVYERSSTVVGGYDGLFLLQGGKWEKWFASCTSGTRQGRGTFEKRDGKLLLYRGTELEILHIYRYQGEIYLVTDDVRTELESGSEEFRRWSSLKKRR